jgi:TonB-linked SusC/RagA family outer membrane protein
MKQKLLIILMVCFAAVTSTFAQSRKITGTVIGTDDGLPIPGVSVKVPGTGVGSQTNAQGAFSLEVSPSVKTLTFSYIGYSSQTVTIGTKTTLSIKLIPDAKALSEVVVVGYGTKSIREANGAIGHVKGDVIADQPVESLDKALGGKIAGVQVSAAGGTLADGVSVRVRGSNSISSSNQPLFVIDGIPANNRENLSLFNGGNGTRFDPLALINPDDIESIDVLKDAGAGAIYGSRAANGVILITTKSGKKGTARITLDSKSSWASASKVPNLLGADDFMTINNEKVKNRFGVAAPVVAVNSDIDGDGQPDRTDWMKQIFRTGFQSDNTIGVSGGSDKAQFYGSVRYADQQGILYGNRLRTAQTRANIDLTPNKYVHGGVQLAYTRSMNDGVLTDNYLAGATISGYNAFPTVSPYNPNASAQQAGFNLSNAGAKEGTGYLGLGNNIISIGGTSLIGNRIYNPLASVSLQRNALTPEDLIANAFFELKPITGLKLMTKFGVDLQKDFEDQYSNPVIAGLGNAYAGLVQDYYLTRNQWVWQNVLNYDNTFGKHRVSFTAGSEYQYTEQQQTYASANNFADPFFTNIVDNAYSGIDPSSTTGALLLASGGNLFNQGLESYFTRLGYTYDDKYSIEGSYRTDAFSGFGSNYRWGKFPAVSLGWVASQEDFLKDNRYINYLKIRGSYGKTGNSSGVGAYAARTLYSGGLYAALNGFSSSQLGNSDLRWESQNKTDIGINIGLFKNRISIDADYFNNDINNLILAAPVLNTVGVPNSSITTNIGSMVNKGIEITINTVNYKNKDFSWTSSLNYTHVTNKVLSLVPSNNNADITSSSTVASVGRPLGTYKLLTWAGVDPANGYPKWSMADGTIKEWNQVLQKYTLADGTTVTTAPGAADQLYQEGKTGTPTWFGGFDNTFTYKGFDLNFSFVYSGGNYLYNSTYAGLLTNTFQNNDARILNRWTTPGQVTDIPRVNSLDNVANNASTRFLEKGDYARLRTIGLGYRVDADLIKRIGLSSLRLSAQVYNAFVITKYSGIDPEVNSNRNNTNIATGYDNRAVPEPRTFTLGVNASF